jgi:hypothetical protein
MLSSPCSREMEMEFWIEQADAAAMAGGERAR